MARRNELIKAILIFAVLSILQPLSNFLLLPVYTSYFSAAEYGYFSILNNIAVFFGIISGLNIATSVVAFYKSYTSENDLRKFIGNIISFICYFNVGLLALIVLWGDGFSNFIFKEKVSFFPDVFYSVLYGLFSTIFLAYFTYLRSQRKLTEFAILSVLQFLVLVGAQYFFIVHLNLKVTGALQARVLVVALIVIITLVLNRKYIFRKIDFAQNIIRQLKYSVITGPAVLIGWLSSYIDRFIIEHRSDTMDLLGQYSFLATIVAIGEIAIYALNSALQPFIFDSYEKDEKPAIRIYYKIFICAVMLCISGLILVGANIGFLIRNEAMLAVLSFIPLMAIGNIFLGTGNLYAMQIAYSRRSTFYLISCIIALIVNIVMNLLLIERFGLIGVIIAGLITKAVLGLAIILFAQRSLHTPGLRPVVALVTLFTVNVVLCWLLNYFGYLSLQVSVVVQLIICILIIAVSVKPGVIQQYLMKQINRGT